MYVYLPLNHFIIIKVHYVFYCDLHTYVGRRRVSKELVVKVPNNPQEIPLVYLIPTKTGKGVCSTALVDFLVTTHNEFIKFYHDIVKIRLVKIVWYDYNITLNV